MYLGSLVFSDGDLLPNTQAGVTGTWLKWHQVTLVLCDRTMPIYLEANVYKTRAECWPATMKHEQTLHAMEMRPVSNASATEMSAVKGHAL